jgi:dolichol-phosphate mannosyltransferase
MLFLAKYRQKPMHLFGTLGFGLFSAGSLIGAYLLLLKFLGHDIGHRPLFFICILFIITSIQLITTGFIAELLMRTYFSTGKNKPYSIAKIYAGGKEIKPPKIPKHSRP